MEQDAVYDLLDANQYNFKEVAKGSAGTDAREALAAPMPGFRCPSTDGPEIFERAGVEYSISSYVASRGFGQAAKFEDILANNGGLGPKPLNIGQLRDGASNTIMLGEASARFSGWKSNADGNPVITPEGRGIGSWSGNFGKGGWDFLNTLSRAGCYPMNDTYHWGFMSIHPELGNFLFGDGSVHSISKSIDFNNAGIGKTWFNDKHEYFYSHVDEMGTWQKLVVRDDGATVALP